MKKIKELKESSTLNNSSMYDITQYFGLPGLIGERLYEIMGSEKNGVILESQFLSVMAKLYNSSIQEKELLIFRMYAAQQVRLRQRRNNKQKGYICIALTDCSCTSLIR